LRWLDGGQRIQDVRIIVRFGFGIHRRKRRRFFGGTGLRLGFADGFLG
jgi:hypothetical protein